MQKFIIKLLLFIAPLVIFLTIPVAVLYHTKENFFDIDKTINSNEKYLIGYVYNENNYRYLKWRYLTSHNQKEVWALGSSRVLSFRDQMFDVSFYNAGYTILGINDFLPFLKSIPKDKYPKYMIIGLDQWMFNAEHDKLETRPTTDSWKNSFRFFPEPFAYLGVYKDLLAGKYNLGILKDNTSPDKIGLNAKINGRGFENDGSMYYGSQITKLISNDPTANDYRYTNTFERIKNGNNLFEYGASVNDKALVELDRILKFSKDNQIEVIAVLPPYADAVYKRMELYGNYGYLKEIFPKIKSTFKKYNYEVYDFSTVSSVGSSDNETLDGFHGGELTYERLLIKVLNSGSILNRVANVNELKTDISEKKNNYQIYDY